MDAILDLLGLSDDSPTLMLSLLVFLAAATLAFGVMATVHVRGSIKRRANDVISGESDRSANDPRSLRHASRKAAARLIDYTTRHYSGTDEGDMRKLRKQLVQAGFLDPRAVAVYFIARIGLAIGL